VGEIVKRNLLLGVLGVSLAACGTTDSTGPSPALLFGNPGASGTTYGGRATVVSSRVLLVKTTLGDTGPLPATGGSLQSTLLTVSVPGVLAGVVANAATEGGNDKAASAATVNNLSVGLLGLGVSASLVASTTEARCVNGTPVVSGGSEVANLVINGATVTVTGSPNQTIYLPVGRVIINEQTGSAGNITVSALRIVVGGLTDVVISRSQSSISCAVFEPM
jgi:hypothetical protein